MKEWARQRKEDDTKREKYTKRTIKESLKVL